MMIGRIRSAPDVDCLLAFVCLFEDALGGGTEGASSKGSDESRDTDTGAAVTVNTESDKASCNGVGSALWVSLSGVS